VPVVPAVEVAVPEEPLDVPEELGLPVLPEEVDAPLDVDPVELVLLPVVPELEEVLVPVVLDAVPELLVPVVELPALDDPADVVVVLVLEPLPALLPLVPPLEPPQAVNANIATEQPSHVPVPPRFRAMSHPLDCAYYMPLGPRSVQWVARATDRLSGETARRPNGNR
jgi:hypothetical protein